jgi:hypothetical protein
MEAGSALFQNLNFVKDEQDDKKLVKRKLLSYQVSQTLNTKICYKAKSISAQFM